jgi:hypothetical protein
MMIENWWTLNGESESSSSLEEQGMSPQPGHATSGSMISYNIYDKR